VRTLLAVLSYRNIRMKRFRHQCGELCSFRFYLDPILSETSVGIGKAFSNTIMVT